MVADVRRFPTSKFPHYIGENLKMALIKEHIGYIPFQGLGGYRDKGYEEHMKSREWLEDFEGLKGTAKAKTTAFMCAERFPFRCHRRYIARKLHDDGWKVIHILDHKVWKEKRGLN